MLLGEHTTPLLQPGQANSCESQERLWCFAHTRASCSQGLVKLQERASLPQNTTLSTQMSRNMWRWSLGRSRLCQTPVADLRVCAELGRPLHWESFRASPQGFLGDPGTHQCPGESRALLSEPTACWKTLWMLPQPAALRDTRPHQSSLLTTLILCLCQGGSWAGPRGWMGRDGTELCAWYPAEPADPLGMGVGPTGMSMGSTQPLSGRCSLSLPLREGSTGSAAVPAVQRAWGHTAAPMEWEWEWEWAGDSRHRPRDSPERGARIGCSPWLHSCPGWRQESNSNGNAVLLN